MHQAIGEVNLIRNSARDNNISNSIKLHNQLFIVALNDSFCFFCINYSLKSYRITIQF